MSPVRWRLLLDPPASGAWNMAVDEAILQSTVRGAGRPTLRLYAWRPAAVSLGANQPVTRDARFLRDEGIHLVRRPTGGLAVLHEHELTYAVGGRLRSAAFPGAVLDSYLRIAEALVAALQALGVAATISGAGRRGAGRPDRSRIPACFGSTSAHEIGAAGGKLVGSAQLRRRGAFLQHGSIPLAGDPERAARAIGGPAGAAATDLTRELGHAVDRDALVAALVRAFEDRFGARLEAGELSDTERDEATLLYSWKYLSAAWTLLGVSPPPGRPGSVAAAG